MESLLKKASKIKMLIMDVDGILSNGQIIYDAQGIETKTFHVQDGFGIQQLHQAGIQTAIITGRNSDIVTKRAKELNITHLVQGREDKLVALKEILLTTGMHLSECAYIGDDWPDIKALQVVGFSVTVPNAHHEVIKRVDMVTTRQGGDGAVREVCDMILKAIGQYETRLTNYLLVEKLIN